MNKKSNYDKKNTVVIYGNRRTNNLNRIVYPQCFNCCFHCNHDKQMAQTYGGQAG